MVCVLILIILIVAIAAAAATRITFTLAISVVFPHSTLTARGAPADADTSLADGMATGAASARTHEPYGLANILDPLRRRQHPAQRVLARVGRHDCPKGAV
jgi:hypothetical protein